MMNLIHRMRFHYTLWDIVEYLLRCLCFRKYKLKRYKGPRENWNRDFRKHYQYDEGEDKLNAELDVLTLLKMQQKVKLLT
jgi:hypothetical protein